MAWRIVRRAVGRYREIALALAFLGTAAYESLEMWMLELPRASSVPVAMLVHALQVVIVLVATWAVLRAWQQKTAHEEALARMVEKVVGQLTS